MDPLVTTVNGLENVMSSHLSNANDNIQEIAMFYRQVAERESTREARRNSLVSEIRKITNPNNNHIHHGPFPNSHGSSGSRGALLGKGGFGPVFLADIDGDFFIDSLFDHDYLLFHPQIAVKSSFLEHSSSLRFEKKYCFGGNLYDRITKFGPKGLPKSEVHRYTRDIIADFGLAMKMTDVRTIGEEDGIGGTRSYLAPELVTNNYPDWSIDIWALGCVVLEMLTGKRVWGSKTCDLDLLTYICYSNELLEIPNELLPVAIDFLRIYLIRNPNKRSSAWLLLGHPFSCDFS
ncbi:mitogen-activated protein kinase kinase kinase 3-like [Benincasa hispida]|uniref:mitogen-activated protein kinase kinase kinase 3-like n=1 Tax=Benincasa hispida TaxID=102211 RepID=UPI001900D81F|nr:mitogen-activated protein kinase kinase kinase 3-like [Benincasa hispida]